MKNFSTKDDFELLKKQTIVTKLKEDEEKPKKHLRVEQHVIKPEHPYFSVFANFTHQSKNLYNHANYLIRQEFINNGKWLRFQDLDELLKNDTEYPDYKTDKRRNP